jgi:hypothetical protein
MILLGASSNHGASFGEFLHVHREAILETAHTLLFTGLWLLVTPRASTETLRGDAGTFENLTTSCFRHRWRTIAGNAQSLAYSWIVANAGRLNWSQILAKANNHSLHRIQSHDELSIQSNVQREIMYGSIHKGLLVALWIREP